MQKYRILGKKGEGTFSEVLKCQSIEDGQYYACKRMKQQFDSIDRVNNLREIQCMRRLSPHTNIVDLKEVIFDKKTGTLALIIELLDMNLYEVIKGRRNYLTESKCRQYIYQTLKALDHMHRNGIFHRDIKPENILLKNDVVKLADFGSCRSVYSKQPYTEYISTRWYRAPECLLTDGWYTYKMDVWSIGCVLAEIASLRPLFPGSNELDQINKIHHVMGTPTPELLNKFKKSKHMDFNFPPSKGTGLSQIFSHLTKDSLNMIESLCTYDPDERPSAKQVLRHQYFKQLRDLEKRDRRTMNKDLDGNSVYADNLIKNKNKDNTRKTTLGPKTSYLSNLGGGGVAGINDDKSMTFKTTLPKIPVPVTDNNNNNNKSLHKKNLPPTLFPSILQEREKFKPKVDKAKRLGYSEYNLPSLHRLKHGNQL